MFEYMQYAATHRPTQSTRYLYMHVVKMHTWQDCTFNRGVEDSNLSARNDVAVSDKDVSITMSEKEHENLKLSKA